MDIDDELNRIELKVAYAYRAENEAQTDEKKRDARRQRISAETELAYFLRDCDRA